jgi:hypothetical protein
MILPGTAAGRRRAALAFLMLGAALAARALSRDLPHEQTLVFRPGETLRHVPLTLHATVTRVGESEAHAGLTVTLDGKEPRDPRQTLRLPDGDYIVTLDWTLKTDASSPGPKESETSRVERVTLAGGETIVPLAPRARE